MTRGIGSSAAVILCEEATWGTTPPAPSHVYGVGLKSETLGSTKNLFSSDMINAYRANIGLGDGNRGVGGNIVSDLLPEGLEILFKHVLGNPTPTTTGSGPYKHVLKGSPDTAHSFSIEKGIVNISQYFLFKGCRVNSMNINMVQEGFHECTFDFIGSSEAIDSSSGIVGTPAYGTKNGYTGYQARIFYKASANLAELSDTSSTQTGWTELGNIVSGDMTLNNSVETDGYVLGSPFRASCEYGKREIEGNFVTFFEDAVLYNIYAAGTEIALKFLYDNTGAGGAEQMAFAFPKVKLSGECPKIESAAGMNLPLGFRARRDATTGIETDIVMTVVNSFADFDH